MAFVVLYDACVLYPAPLRDLLIRLANTGVVRARWSATILDECFRNILENRPDLKPESLERTRELMTQAVPDCMVTNFEGLIDALVLPDVDDRHVLAAAIRAGAQAIVTFNLADFPYRPPRALQHGSEAPRRLRDRYAGHLTRRRGEGDRGSGSSSERSTPTNCKISSRRSATRGSYGP